MSKKVLVATEKPFSPAAVEELQKVLNDAKYNCVMLEKYTDKADLLAAHLGIESQHRLPNKGDT